MDEYALFEEIIIPSVAINYCFSAQLVLGVLGTPLGIIAMDDYLESLVSLERLSNARRPESQTIEKLIEESLAKVQKYLAALVEEG